MKRMWDFFLVVRLSLHGLILTYGYESRVFTKLKKNAFWQNAHTSNAYHVEVKWYNLVFSILKRASENKEVTWFISKTKAK